MKLYKLRPQRWPLIMIFCYFGCVVQGQMGMTNQEDIQRSGRLITDILEMFAPAAQSDSRRSRLPPFGINRAYSEEERLGVTPTNLRRSPDQKPMMALTQEIMNMFNAGTTTLPPTTTRSSFSNGIFDNLAKRFEIPGMFKSLFNSDEEKVTTTQAPTTTLFPTFPTFPPLPLFPQFFTPSTTTQESILQGLGSIFDKPKPGSQIDTGKMDRFIIREQAAPDDFWSNLAGGSKWNERGIQFEDGNLKFVNKKGNKVLGTEVGVHDRSVDIPVQRWFDIANDVLTAAYQQRQSV